MDVKTCSNCYHLNSENELYCVRCNMPLAQIDPKSKGEREQSIQNPEFVEGKPLRNCEKCGKKKKQGTEKDQAMFYEFHYGEERGSKKRLYSGPVPAVGITTTTFYQINSDTAKVFLCHDCVLNEYLRVHPSWSFREDWKSILIFIFVFVILFAISLLESSGGCGGVTILLLIVSTYYGIKAAIEGNEVYQKLQRYEKFGARAVGGLMYSTDWERLGDNLAIEIRKSQFEKRGYDSFFTRYGYRNLKQG